MKLNKLIKHLKLAGIPPKLATAVAELAADNLNALKIKLSNRLIVDNAVNPDALHELSLKDLKLLHRQARKSRRWVEGRYKDNIHGISVVVTDAGLKDIWNSGDGKGVADFALMVMAFDKQHQLLAMRTPRLPMGEYPSTTQSIVGIHWLAGEATCYDCNEPIMATHLKSNGCF